MKAAVAAIAAGVGYSGGVWLGSRIRATAELLKTYPVTVVSAPFHLDDATPVAVVSATY